jgi:2-polyprenyl-6-methoxyphenol hydroxylase-like FAD-dependent oxidoreductase
VFAASTPARIGRGGRQTLEDVVRQASPSLADRIAEAHAPAGVRSFAGRPSYLRRSWGPGWALVGDAGSWKDPISTHGLTDALRDAELLARAIVASAAGELTEAEALAGYQAEQDRLTLPLLTATDAIARYDWTDAEIRALLLELSSSMTAEIEAIGDLDGLAVRH